MIERIAIFSLAIFILFHAPAFSQTPKPTKDPASRFFDEYGNARTSPKPRRTLGGTFGTAELVPSSSIAAGLGLRPRGGLPRGAESTDPFSYVSRPGAKPISRLDLLLSSPNVVPAWKQQVFHAYGGFGQRQAIKRGTEGASAMSRRYALIGAESLNAPVVRANWQNGFTSRVRLEVDQMPFDAAAESEPSDESLDDTLADTTLEEKLREDNETTLERLRTEGWEAFKDGNYRRAARTFASASSVEGDNETRIGELFSHYSLGAMRTASAVLSGLDRGSANPFVGDLDLPSKFGRLDDVTRGKIQARLDATSSQSTPETAALAIFILWQLNDREEARSAAARLVRHAEAAAYSGWPQKMKSASPSDGASATQP